MSARWCLAVSIGILFVPMSHATVSGAAISSDAAGQSVDMFLNEAFAQDFFGATGAPTYALREVSSTGYGKIPSWDWRHCELGRCVSFRDATFDQQGGGRSSDSMTALDGVLMLLFAAGLVTYQLVRKQRVLQQSSLFAATL